MPNASTPLTSSISEADVREGFACGVEALDVFFRRHALSNDKRGLGKTFVLHGEGTDSPKILGYYTLSMATVESKVLAASVREALPRYPVPVGLIGRLAVSEAARGRGIGGRLLADAIHRILLLANEIGCFGVVVDAKDDSAMAFYVRHGFIDVDPPHMFPRRLFLSLSTARDSAK